MNRSTLRRLGVALVALVAAWGITTLRARRDATDSAPALAAFFAGLTEETVSAVRLVGPRDTVTLVRRGSGWTANGFRTDSLAVALFWRAVGRGGAGEVAASSPANHRRLGVAADSTWRAEFELPQGLRTIFLGTAGPRPSITYGRFPDQDTVYQLAGELHLRVAHPLGDWRDRRILALDTSSIARIDVESGRQRYTLARGPAGWTLSGGQATDPEAVRTVLSELARLRALDFLVPGDSIARRPRGGSVSALAASGDTLGAVEFGAGPGDRWARARGDSVLYRLGSHRVDRIAPERQRVIAGTVAR